MSDTKKENININTDKSPVEILRQVKKVIEKENNDYSISTLSNEELFNAIVDEITPSLTEKQKEQINRMNVASQRADMGDILDWLIKNGGGGGGGFTEDEIKQFVEEKATSGTLTDLLIENGLYSYKDLLNVLENSQSTNQLFVNSSSQSIIHDGKYLTPFLNITDAINGSVVQNKNLILLGTDTYTGISSTASVSNIIGENCSVNTVALNSSNITLKLFKINTSLDIYAGVNIQCYVKYCAGNIVVHAGSNNPTIVIDKLDGNITIEGDANANPCSIFVKSWDNTKYTITADPTNLVSGSTIGNQQYGMVAVI